VLIFATQVVFAVGKVTVLYEFELVTLEVMMMEIMETEAGNCVTNNTGSVSSFYFNEFNTHYNLLLGPSMKYDKMSASAVECWLSMKWDNIVKCVQKLCEGNFINIIRLNKKFNACEHTLELPVYSLHCRCVTNTK